jgi:hypothetical protein
MHVQNSAISDEAPVARLNPPTALKRRSVALMIALTVISLGFYYPIWFLRRRTALNSLDSPRKLEAWPFLLLLGYWIAQFSVSIAAGGRPLAAAFGEGAAMVLSLVQLGVGIVTLVQCFFIKDILEDHLAGPEDTLSSGLLSDRVQLSPILTFLFQIFYLQYVINRSVVGAQPAGV